MSDAEELSEQSKAAGVLETIDKLLSWKSNVEQWLEKYLAQLGTLLYEAKQNKYYKFRGYQTEDEWIESIFPQSRSQYYALIGIGHKLCPILPVETIQQIGRCKCEDLTRIVRHVGELKPEWVTRAIHTPQMEFRNQVRAFIANSVANPAPDAEVEFVTVKLCSDQIRVWHKAIDCMNQQLGSDKSVAFAVEMIFADYLASKLDDGSTAIEGHNWFILNRVKRYLDLIDWNDTTMPKRVLGMVTNVLEKARDQESNIGS